MKIFIFSSLPNHPPISRRADNIFISNLLSKKFFRILFLIFPTSPLSRDRAVNLLIEIRLSKTVSGNIPEFCEDRFRDDNHSIGEAETESIFSAHFFKSRVAIRAAFSMMKSASQNCQSIDSPPPHRHFSSRPIRLSPALFCPILLRFGASSGRYFSEFHSQSSSNIRNHCRSWIASAPRTVNNNCNWTYVSKNRRGRRSEALRQHPGEPRVMLRIFSHGHGLRSRF